MRRGKLKPKKAGDGRAGSAASICRAAVAVSTWYLTEHRNIISVVIIIVCFFLLQPVS